MGRGQSSGTDLLPVEFYIEYIDVIIPQLLYNSALEEGQLRTTMRQAIITVILRHR